MKDIVTLFSEQYSETRETEMSLQDYLLGCRDNPDMYASVAERMLTAIGHEKLVDTSKDSRLKRFAFNLIHILPRRRSSNIRQE